MCSIQRNAHKVGAESDDAEGKQGEYQEDRENGVEGGQGGG